MADCCTSFPIKLSMFVFKLVKYYQIKLFLFLFWNSMVSLSQKLLFRNNRQQKKSTYEPTTIVLYRLYKSSPVINLTICSVCFVQSMVSYHSHRFLFEFCHNLYTPKTFRLIVKSIWILISILIELKEQFIR